MKQTKFVSVNDAQIEEKETVFTHELDGYSGYIENNLKVTYFEKVVYLGNCSLDGDMFACYTEHGAIAIFKGTKGDEFNH